MKKLLFIIPPYFNADDYLNKSRAAVLPAFTMPYGILSMESYLSARCRSTIVAPIGSASGAFRAHS